MEIHFLSLIDRQIRKIFSRKFILRGIETLIHKKLIFYSINRTSKCRLQLKNANS